MQAEATENDPYARSYLAQPQYPITDDSPTGPLTPPLSPYTTLRDDSVVAPDMAGGGTMDYDSDDEAPQDFPEPDSEEPRDQQGYTRQDWEEWNYQMGMPPPTLEQNLTWVSGSGGGYPQDIYTVTQQSDVKPSIPLLRIGKGPAPRYSAPIPPRRGVHLDNTPSLYPIPEVVHKCSNPHVSSQDPNNLGKWDPNNYKEVKGLTVFERPEGCPQ